MQSTMEKEDFSSVNDEGSAQGDLPAALRDGDSRAFVGAEILEGIRQAAAAGGAAKFPETESGDGTASKRPRLTTKTSSPDAGPFLTLHAPKLESTAASENNPPSRRWMSSTGRRAPRVGNEFQVDALPDPSSFRSVVSPTSQDES
jgi:hypothetical protein